MNCQQARQLFSPWLDGELTGEEAGALRAHLAACRSCAAELARLREITAALRNLRVPVAPPDGFAARVTERLRKPGLEPAAGEAGRAAEGTGRPAVAAAAGKVVPPAGRKLFAPGSGGFGPAAAGGGFWFAGWRQALRAGWKKGAAVAATLVLLFGGSVTLAARYFGWPGLFNAPVVVGQVPSPDAGAGTGVTIDQGGHQDAQGSQGQVEPGDAGTTVSPQNGDQGKQPVSEPVSRPGEGEQGRLLAAGNSPGTPGRQPEKPAGEVGAGGGPQAQGQVTAGAGGEPKVFLNQPRAVESVLIKVRVDDLDEAAGRLAAGARARGIACQPVNNDEKIKIYRLPVPKAQDEQFTAYVAGLGRVFHQSRDIRDISNAFAEKLDYYQKLIEERKAASGTQAKKLDADIQKVKEELETMDREAREQVILIVWLEQ
ncbi:MAG: anti-sigma factor [Bacillota bacterium]